MWLVEMAISTNHISKILGNHFKKIPDHLSRRIVNEWHSWILFAQVAGRFCGQEMLVQPVVSDWNWGIISRVEDAVCTPRVHHMAWLTIDPVLEEPCGTTTKNDVTGLHHLHVVVSDNTYLKIVSILRGGGVATNKISGGPRVFVQIRIFKQSNVKQDKEQIKLLIKLYISRFFQKGFFSQSD